MGGGGRDVRTSVYQKRKVPTTSMNNCASMTSWILLLLVKLIPMGFVVGRSCPGALQSIHNIVWCTLWVKGTAS